MMSRKLLRIRVFLILIVLMSVSTLTNCKKNKSDKLKGDLAVFNGVWDWDNSYHNYGWCDGMMEEEYITPDDYGSSFKLDFLEKGELVFYKNGSVLNTKNIVFKNFTKDESGEISFNISLNGDAEDEFYGYGDDSFITVYTFPFNPVPGCESYLNVFEKK